MKTQYIGLEKINGPIVWMKTPENIGYNEQVHLILPDGEVRIGNVISTNTDVTAIQVYEGSENIRLKDIKIEQKGEPLKLNLSEEMLRQSIQWKGRTD